MKYRSSPSVCRFTTHSRPMSRSATDTRWNSSKCLVLVGLALLTSMGPLAAQQGRKNLAAFDTKKYHFGFALSGNRSDFNMALTPDYSFSDSLQAIINQPQAGFDLALVASWDATKNFHVRFLPGLSFQDRALEYRFEKDGEPDLKVRRTESVYLNFPLLLKLRTDRVGNFAAYAIVGGKLSKDMQSQEETNQQLASDFILRLESGNSSIDLGAGVDIFLPFFKFSVEGKFELGSRNIMIQDDSRYSAPLQSLKTRSFILSLCFEG